MNAGVSRGGEPEFLRGYDPDDFPPFAVTVDLAIFTIRAGQLSVLLVQRGGHPYRGCWALRGGFVRAGESADDAAVRELAEETGVADFRGHLEQLQTYSALDRDPRMRVVSIAHVALAPDLPDPEPGGDALKARWWPASDLQLKGLAFDHALILSDALERIRSKLEYTTLAAALTAEPFTLADLRAVYAAVWGTAPDLGNFRRKVQSTEGFVIQEGRSGAPAAGTAGGRPPQLYRRGPATLLHPPILRPQGPAHV
jgi:8-oxo-dGTP diphosphatase